MEAKRDRDTHSKDLGKHGRPREGEAGSGATIQGPRGLPKGQEKAGKQNSSLSLYNLVELHLQKRSQETNTDENT